jgi:hypothetical protein
MPATARDLLASLLGESPQQAPAAPAQPQEHPLRARGPAGPWRVTASASGGRVQISNQESRLIPKSQLESYLRTPAGAK